MNIWRSDGGDANYECYGVFRRQDWRGRRGGGPATRGDRAERERKRNYRSAGCDGEDRAKIRIEFPSNIQGDHGGETLSFVDFDSVPLSAKFCLDR